MCNFCAIFQMVFVSLQSNRNINNLIIMATTKYIIGKRGGDRPELTIRLTVNNLLRVQTKVPGVLVYRQYWSDPKQCNDLSRKFIKPWEQEEMTNINKTLSGLSSEVIAKAAATSKDEITKPWLDAVIDKYLHPAKFAPKEEKPLTLMDIVSTFVEDAEQGKVLNDGERLKTGTVKTYRQVYNYLVKFATSEKRKDYETDELTAIWYDRFVSFLYSQGMNKNSVGKEIKCLKTILNKRIPHTQRAACELVERGKCKVLKEDVNNVFLDEDQLKVRAVHPFTGGLEKVRDLFLVLAWTGQRYSDLEQLTAKNIHTTEDGKHRYFKVRQTKTDAVVLVPIVPELEAVLTKYNDCPPKPISNQKFNDTIKEVCKAIANTEAGKAAGFADNVELERTLNAEKQITVKPFYECVTSHTGRRSYATNGYRRDVPLPLLMSVTGHTSESMFFKYIKENPEQGRERMLNNYFRLIDSKS